MIMHPELARVVPPPEHQPSRGVRNSLCLSIVDALTIAISELSVLEIHVRCVSSSARILIVVELQPGLASGWRLLRSREMLQFAYNAFVMHMSWQGMHRLSVELTRSPGGRDLRLVEACNRNWKEGTVQLK